MIEGVTSNKTHPQVCMLSSRLDTGMYPYLNLFISLYLLLCCGIVTSDEFNCPPLPPLTRPAQSVHELRPQDIKVVMALGDSVTAGQYYFH